MALVKPQLNGDVLAYDELQTDEINKIADYVVERDPNNRWEKWNSGKLVQRDRYKVEGTTDNKLKINFYRSVITTRSYHLPFVGQLPVLNHSLEAVLDTTIPMTSYGATLLKPVNVSLGYHLPNADVSAFFNYEAVGRWK